MTLTIPDDTLEATGLTERELRIGAGTDRPHQDDAVIGGPQGHVARGTTVKESGYRLKGVHRRRWRVGAGRAEADEEALYGDGNGQEVGGDAEERKKVGRDQKIRWCTPRLCCLGTCLRD